MNCYENNQSFNINSFNSWNVLQAGIPDDKAQVLRWLSPLEPRKRHRHLRESRIKGVGQWIFRTTEFRRWNTGKDGSSHSVLFCHGDPGVGKTHLSSLVMDYFYYRRRDITVAGLYCDYLDRNEQTISNMLGALLKQLVGGGNVPEDIRQAFEDAKGHLGGVGLEVSELLKMLKTAIRQRQRVAICIDGLDESLAANRTGLLNSLQTIVRELPNVRLFLAGRPFIRIEVKKYFPGMDTISVSPTKEDIKAFLETKLDGDTEPDAMDEWLRADIMEIIPKKISEIFLLVSLSIEAILGETTIHRREEKLKQISKGQNIGDLYTATLSRIKAQEPDKSRLGMEAIMWVAHSEQPLRPEELCQALGVEIGSQDLNNRNVPSIRTILNCGLGLVTLDSSSSRVRLVHFTLQEYIVANPTLFLSPHSAIAEVCLTYLHFRCIRDLSPTLSSPPPTTPFLKYASCHWGAHARKETNKSVISLALKLLDQFDEHISCKLLIMREYKWWHRFDIHGRPTGFTGIHGAAFLGVVEVMASLFEVKRWDPNATDLAGNTALVLAARNGHVGVVKMLLDRKDVNPNLSDKDGRAPLFWAVNHDCEETAMMLLGQNNINPDIATNHGLTPLERAVVLGRERIAVTLLERSDVDPDAADVNGRTPFSRATTFMRERLLGILLERGDVNPDSADHKGRTSLSRAAEEWTVEIVEMLLERSDVNPDAPDNQGRTPLSWASVGWTDPDDAEWDTEGDIDPEYHWGEVREGNCERVAEMLLEKNGVNPDAADNSGRTPLSWAASHGNEVFVKLLLERSDVNPNTTDEKGRTPLAWATIYRHREIMKMLLERNNVDPDPQDKNGRTPLSWAAENGYVWIAEMLLGRSGVNPDTRDRNGRTPLSWAAEGWNVEIVEILLGRSDVNPDTPDMRGRTPLSWAAASGCEEIAETLLGRNNVDPDTQDKGGRTPISWAAENGYVWIVKMLLDRGGINPDIPDKRGRTPLSWAVENGCEEIVELLLERPNVNPNIRDESGQTPLAWAAKSGNGEIVKMLLERNDVNPGMVDKSGQTPYSLAARSRHEDIMNLLLGRYNANSDFADETSRTLFFRSTRGLYEGAAGIPFERNDANPDTEAKAGLPLLLRATANERAGAGQLLRGQHDLTTNSVPRKVSSKRFATEPPELPEPPLKRIRLF